METVLDESVRGGVPAGESTEVAGKYLTFMLDGEEYGVEILKVREIIGLQDIAVVPQTTNFVRGVINLRGKVIPVIDLRAKFQLPDVDYDDETCIVVVDVGMLMGVIVDTVREVHDIPASAVEAAPKLGTAVDNDFILGMGKIRDEVKILLDIERVLNADDLVQPLDNAGA